MSYGGGALNRLKWLVHFLMLQWLWCLFALISRLSDLHINIPHDVLISVWNDWFMISCCNGCGVGMPSFLVSPIHILCLPHDVFISRFFRRRVVCTTAVLVQIRAQYFPS